MQREVEWKTAQEGREGDGVRRGWEARCGVETGEDWANAEGEPRGPGWGADSTQRRRKEKRKLGETSVDVFVFFFLTLSRCVFVRVLFHCSCCPRPRSLLLFFAWHLRTLERCGGSWVRAALRAFSTSRIFRPLFFSLSLHLFESLGMCSPRCLRFFLFLLLLLRSPCPSPWHRRARPLPSPPLRRSACCAALVRCPTLPAFPRSCLPRLPLRH